ncbi:MAG: Rid family hydrolase [bacterium]|nr:Rid family hydrolase [bacterium]
MKKVYKSSEGTNAPLSGAQEVDGLVFVSGQIHVNSVGQLEGNSIEEKFSVVISNVKKILGEAGLTLEDVVRVHLYLTDLTELPALNKVYTNYFEHPLPARTAIGVSALPLGASLEMDVIATRIQ